MAYPGSATYRATNQPEIGPRNVYSTLRPPEVIAGPDSASPLPSAEKAETETDALAAGIRE
jgi:hypothetical protein